ncbi:MAG TPA: PIG-L family deacetylase [Nitrospirales bacterium]
MNILVIAPHPDDESIGCGGTLCLHARRADRIAVVYLTSGELGLKHLPRNQAWRTREREAEKAAKILGIGAWFFLRLPDWSTGDDIGKAAKKLNPLVRRLKPDLIYLPHAQEWHPDHQAALPIVRAALKGPGISRPAFRAYEVWTPLAEYDHVEDISAVMPRKLRALRAHRSQLKTFDYPRAVSGLNQFRGELAARCRYAEVFQAVAEGDEKAVTSP